MRDLLKRTGLVITLCLAVAAAVPAIADDLPDAESVIEAYIEATGGREAYASHTNWYGKGAFEMPAMGIKATVTSYVGEAGRNYTLIESEMLGKMESGSDGVVSWDKSLMSGPRIITGEEKAASQREGAFDKWTNWKSYYTSAKTIGVVDIEGDACLHLEMTPTVGQAESFYFNQDTHLLAKHAATMESEMGSVSREMFMSDYRQTGGVLMPFVSRMVLMGMQEIVFNFESIEFDAPIPEGTFDLPADIRALVQE